MLDILVLRLDAPLLSFGTTAVDQHRRTQPFPALSMLTGLLANAMGFDHRDTAQLDDLQSRLRYAARCDRRGTVLVDYQTVSLDQPFLIEGWTTRGRPEGRGGSADNKTGTHIRHRHFHADSLHTVVLTFAPGTPDLDAVEHALQEPARPLFIGRKCCLPSRPLLWGRIQAPSLVAALEQVPLDKLRGDTPPLQAWWPMDESRDSKEEIIATVDERDWAGQVHGGRRLLRHGLVSPPEGDHVR